MHRPSRPDFTIRIDFKALEDYVSYLKSSGVDQMKADRAADLIMALTQKLIDTSSALSKAMELNKEKI